jgi:hypothetical protein
LNIPNNLIGYLHNKVVCKNPIIGKPIQQLVDNFNPGFNGDEKFKDSKNNNKGSPKTGAEKIQRNSEKSEKGPRKE